MQYGSNRNRLSLEESGPLRYLIIQVGRSNPLLPAFLDFANALVKPFVLRNLDAMLGCKAQDGAGKLLHLGLAVGDAILCHGGHAIWVKPLDNAQHLGKIRLRERNAPGEPHPRTSSGQGVPVRRISPARLPFDSPIDAIWAR